MKNSLMFLNINQFLLKLQLSCASRTICISILSQISFQGFKLSRPQALMRNQNRRAWLQCLPDLLCNESTGFLCTCSAGTGGQHRALAAWLLTSSWTAKKENKAGYIPSLCITLVKTQRRPFKLQAQLLPLSIQHEFLFVIYRLAIGWMLAAQFPHSCTVSSIHLCKEKQNICCILHCKTEGTGAHNSCGFISLSGGVFCLFFSLRER